MFSNAVSAGHTDQAVDWLQLRCHQTVEQPAAVFCSHSFAWAHDNFVLITIEAAFQSCPDSAAKSVTFIFAG